MELTQDEIHELHMALAELLDFFKNDPKHQKEHEKEICEICTDYKKLHDRLLENCECIMGGKKNGFDK